MGEDEMCGANQFAMDRESFVELIRHWHANHPRDDQLEHCINVAQWVERALDREPGPVPARSAIIFAALGHDLYEDTAIKTSQVVERYGRTVDQLIEAVTERNNVTAFVERVASGPEECWLIKLSDGIDNYHGLVAKGLLDAQPGKWVEIVRKQMEPMFNRLAGLPFQHYTAAGPWLSQVLHEQRELFWGAVCRILGGC